MHGWYTHVRRIKYANAMANSRMPLRSLASFEKLPTAFRRGPSAHSISSTGSLPTGKMVLSPCSWILYSRWNGRLVLCGTPWAIFQSFQVTRAACVNSPLRLHILSAERACTSHAIESSKRLSESRSPMSASHIPAVNFCVTLVRVPGQESALRLYHPALV